MQKLFIGLATLFVHSLCISQDTLINNSPTAKKYLLATRVSAPLGDFSNTHLAGLGLEFSLSKGRFGSLKKKPSKIFGWVGTSGIAGFYGKKEDEVTSAYRYPIFLYIYLNGGIIANPAKDFSFSLNTGPALGIYNGTTRLNIRVAADGKYFVSDKIAVGVGTSLIKESISEPLWDGSLIISYAF